MRTRRKILLVATITLLVVTILWAIAVYQHIQAYRKFIEGLSELERTWGLWEPCWVWGNGPILIISGCILLFAWIVLITEWWKVSK